MNNCQDVGPETRFIIDSCAFDAFNDNKPSLRYQLEHFLDPEADRKEICGSVKSYLEALSATLDFSRAREMVFLGSVLDERACFYDIVKNRVKAVKTGFPRKAKSEPLTEDFGSLMKHAERFMEVFREANALMQRRRFSVNEFCALQRTIYDFTLNLARSVHTYTRGKDNLPTLGEIAETDRKIMASAAALALKNPVVIISKDSGIIGRNRTNVQSSLEKIVPHLRTDPCSRTHKGLNITLPFSIGVYNPDSSKNGKGFYDPDKVRLVYGVEA
ncbi:MAG: hypothetical protein AABW80_01825 [Nanoarchaeota archaeon]